MTSLKERGTRYAIVDAVRLPSRGHRRGGGGHALLTGGSGIAMGLPENFRRAGLLDTHEDAGTLPDVAGTRRCSPARARARPVPDRDGTRPCADARIDALATPTRRPSAAQALAWADGRSETGRW